MISRERVLMALSHREPDRVPVDLGGTDVTSIQYDAYRRLRARLRLAGTRLGLAGLAVTLAQPDQLLPRLEEPVLRLARTDAEPVEFQSTRWVESTFPAGEPTLLPVECVPEPQPDGSWVIRSAAGQVTSRLAQGAPCFRQVRFPLADVNDISDLDRHQADIDALDACSFAPMDFAALGERAAKLMRESERFLALYVGGHIFSGAQWMLGYEKFMTELVLRPKLAQALLERITRMHIERFEKFADAVGANVHMVLIADDLGSQKAPQLSPQMYRKFIKPHQAALCRAIRDRLTVHLCLHTDGAVRDLIPDFIDIGIDVLNPIQVSAAGMDTAALKREFGGDISFWGGGCDTQHVLPRGTPQQVRDEVRRRIDDLAPGGGFIFSHIHNMPPETPPENIIAMYEAVRRV
jgi:uroporphyrinogen decarboxylase